MSLTLQEIYEALRTNRKEFSGLFIQAQSALNLAQRFEFEVIAVETSDDQSAVLKALQHAQTRNFLNPLLQLIVQSSLETGAIAKMLIEDSPRVIDNTLQSIINANGFTEPDTYYRGIAKGMKWTGKVIINGQSMGTGILVGANLFLTAWHVVHTLFHPGTREPMENVSVLVEFDNFLYVGNGGYQQNNSEKIYVHQNWHVSHCRCHENELIPGSVIDPANFENNWDYIIIRLEKTIGFERGWAKMDSRAVVPEEQQRIVLFQHAAGHSMRIDEGIITGLTPTHHCIPKYRFLHMANSVQGSSGGPCFDKEFSLVGIHQGSWPESTIGNTPVAEQITRNRGIPITNIISHIKSNLEELPIPSAEESPCYCLKEGIYEPVIGCDNFQVLIWSSVLRSDKKIISITGQPYTGKSFMIRLADTLLTDQHHLKISLPAERISKMSVPEMLIFVSQLMGIKAPDITSLTDYDNTPSAWLRNHIFPEFIRSLEESRKERVVWLLFPDLNRFDLEGSHLGEFVLIILEGIKTYDWLRIILDGARQALPLLTNSYTTEHRCQPITEKQIDDYLKRIIVKFEKDQDTKLAANLLHKNYQRDLIKQPDAALPELRLMVMDTINSIIQ